MRRAWGLRSCGPATGRSPGPRRAGQTSARTPWRPSYWLRRPSRRIEPGLTARGLAARQRGDKRPGRAQVIPRAPALWQPSGRMVDYTAEHLPEVHGARAMAGRTAHKELCMEFAWFDAWL